MSLNNNANQPLQSIEEKIDMSQYEKMEIVSVEVDGKTRNEGVITVADTKGKDKITLNITIKK